MYPKVRLKIALSREILHTDPRNRDMTELFKQIQIKGVSQAWTDYVIEDLNELIIDNGAEYVLQNLDPKAKQLLIDYIKGKKLSRIDTIGQNGNDGLHYESDDGQLTDEQYAKIKEYEYELNKSTGQVEKKFNGS
jgi:hypothetical protein